MTMSHSQQAERLITQHFDLIASGYHAVAFGGAGMGHLSTLDLELIRRAADLVPPGAHNRLACDVGVGTGRISSELLRVGFEVTGVDASPAMLDQARSRLEGATLKLGSLAQRLPVDDDSAGLVTCLRVVKYLPRWPQAISELARVAAPGGIVCFDLANARSFARFGYPSGMVWGARYAAAVRAIEAADLELLEVHPGPHVPGPVWAAATSPAATRVARVTEDLLEKLMGRHGARWWTFISRKRCR